MITTRPPAMSTVGTIAVTNGTSVWRPSGRAHDQQVGAGPVVDPDDLADRSLAVGPSRRRDARRPDQLEVVELVRVVRTARCRPRRRSSFTPRSRSATSRSSTPSNAIEQSIDRRWTCARGGLRSSAGRPSPGRCRAPTRRRSGPAGSSVVTVDHDLAAHAVRPHDRADHELHQRCVRASDRISTSRRCRPGRPGRRST